MKPIIKGIVDLKLSLVNDAEKWERQAKSFGFAAVKEFRGKKKIDNDILMLIETGELMLDRSEIVKTCISRVEAFIVEIDAGKYANAEPPVPETVRQKPQ